MNRDELKSLAHQHGPHIENMINAMLAEIDVLQTKIDAIKDTKMIETSIADLQATCRSLQNQISALK